LFVKSDLDADFARINADKSRRRKEFLDMQFFIRVYPRLSA